MSSTAVALDRLAYANTIRLAGAKVRRELQALGTVESRKRASEMLMDPPLEVQRMRLDHFLKGIHRVGPMEARRILSEAVVQGDRRIGPDARRDDRVLTERQRRVVASVLLGRANARWAR